MANTDNFYDLSFDELAKILDSESVLVQSEDALLKSVLRWTAGDKTSKSASGEQLRTLLSRLRLEDLSQETLESLRDTKNGDDVMAARNTQTSPNNTDRKALDNL